ncbi:MAG: family 43 glycosylhydrolase [Ignavibacteriaceae bacterium]
MRTLLMICIFILINYTLFKAQENILTNPSFESGETGWNNIRVDNHEYFAPVDGEYYAISESGSVYTSQLTDHIIEWGNIYSTTVWARSIYNDEYVDCLLNCSENNLPQGDSATTIIKFQFYTESGTISSIEQEVNPVAIQGDPQIFPNDDGGNVWIDQGYRMEFADYVFYQYDSANPILDPWTRVNDIDYDHDMAVGPIITPQGLKGLYNTYYEEGDNIYSGIWLLTATGNPPDYQWSSQGIILSNSVDQYPWVFDAHLYYDDETGKLWLTWGGGRIWVTEIDPADGQLINHPDDTEFDTHPEGSHTVVARWNGDEWTNNNSWFEGAALYKYNDYWYLFASYGNLGANYSIRMGRGTSPTGPFYDKEGVGLMEWTSSEAEYGNSFLLGDDSDQLCPGHPHIWEENGRFYMGYDYIPEKLAAQEWDILGIRRLYWVNDWPTIWTPITLTFKSNDHPEVIGKKLGISFLNIGEEGSVLAVDSITLKISIATGIEKTDNNFTPKEFKLYQNYPNPFNPETQITFQIPQTSLVAIDVFNYLGEQVARLINSVKSPGEYKLTFDASSAAGGLSSGVYYYKITAGDFVQIKKCVLLK